MRYVYFVSRVSLSLFESFFMFCRRNMQPFYVVIFCHYENYRLNRNATHIRIYFIMFILLCVSCKQFSFANNIEYAMCFDDHTQLADAMSTTYHQQHQHQYQQQSSNNNTNRWRPNDLGSGVKTIHIITFCAGCRCCFQGDNENTWQADS